MKLFCLFLFAYFLVLNPAIGDSQAPRDFSPRPEERQLPTAMRSEMETLPSIRVGQSDADIVGFDHRALQAAVDYIAGLGGGVVEIGPGEYLMRDSLHIRSNVVVRGTPGETVLRKADAAFSLLALDGDFGEEQITLFEPDGFEPGDGVAIWDDRAGGFHTTVARIIGKRDHTVAISIPLMADCMEHRNAAAATVFPVVSAYYAEGASVSDLIIDGNRENNPYLNGCRGAGIFLYRAHGFEIRSCTVTNYNGDGISFQQSNDVRVIGCVVEGNADLGLHPGSGSQRPEIRLCVARDNGNDGLFLCWRVRHGIFDDNVLEGNGRFGISIGHKDTDNLLRRNIVRDNALNGVFFRLETLGMAAHRNRLEGNLIENNGVNQPSAGIRVRGETNDLEFINNTIRDTRPAGERTQTVGILIEESVGGVVMDGNEIDAETALVDHRETASR